MSYDRPTLSEILEQRKTDLFARLETLDPMLPNSVSEILAAVMSGGLSGNYDGVDWLALQMFADTNDAEHLERWANILGMSRLPAVQASGDGTFTGSIGSSVATNDELISTAGILYRVVTGFTLTATSEDHEIIAVNPGIDGNQDAAVELTLTTTISGIDSTVTVASAGITGGRDRETDDELRVRVLTRFANPPKGGAVHDYVAWTKEAVLATRVFVRNYDNAGDFGDAVAKGEVLVYFAMDSVYSDGIPLSGDVATVQSYIDVRKPTPSVFTAQAPVGYDVDLEFTILPNSSAMQVAVETAMQDAITEFGIVGGTIPLSRIQEAFSGVSGLDSWVINSPTIDILAPPQQLHVLGTITFN